MKPLYPLFTLFLFLLALALIPLVAAQDGNLLTDSLASAGSWLSNIGGQAQQFVTEQPVATGALATTGGAAGILGVAYRGASKAKNMLTGQISGLKTQAETALSQANGEKEKLTQQLNEQTSSVQAQIKTATDQATSKLKAESDSAITALTQQKTQVQLQLEEQKKNYQKLEIAYQERCKITAIP